MKNFVKSYYLESFVCFLIANLLSIAAFAQEAHYPIVKGHGGIFDIQEATAFPDPTLQYKIVVDIKEGAGGHKSINASLNNLARIANLHGMGGVPKENIDIVAVIHGEATISILSDISHENRYGTPNPNTDLIRALLEGGIKLFVCGQSLRARKIDARELTPGIAISLSAVTLVTTYQLKGYAVLSY
ncbi:DsrE family protein [Imperialibacter roseus]|uniref:DsrE family protein n=1 Tax=Imperialibacter roseus TaxID=1324217 RepID=A0ABZ0IM09_9BACT|nr:DsrE family protein [Imperialibacter roseus]WOK05547.1 DsrE family protein [Imperialibacter roseus]|tara:strand:+ start:65225 stop:65785 length:561 start_codon:yes stop_codon:yes gene_type:complete